MKQILLLALMRVFMSVSQCDGVIVYGPTVSPDFSRGGGKSNLNDICDVSSNLILCRLFQAAYIVPQVTPMRVEGERSAQIRLSSRRTVQIPIAMAAWLTYTGWSSRIMPGPSAECFLVTSQSDS